MYEGSAEAAGARRVLAALAALALGARALGGAAAWAPPAREPDRPQCLPAAGARCEKRDYAEDEYFYKIDGHSYKVDFAKGDYYKAACDAVGLDDVATPGFREPAVVQHVTLTGCAPPRASYAAALGALNVTVLRRLTLRRLPADARLAPELFAGLPASFRELVLEAEAVLQPDPNFLEALPALRSLSLDGVRPAHLPLNLEKLKIRNTGIEKLPPEALAVIELEVSEERLTDIAGAAPRLRTLTLTAPVRALPAAPALERAYVSLWAERAPQPLAACARLRVLSLWDVAAEALPGGFVAACGALQSLHLRLPHARALPPRFLFNATALRNITITACDIPALPEDLFRYSPELDGVEFTNINLQSLPSDVFSWLVPSLRSLSLEDNALRAEDVLRAVAPLTQLRSLNLARNPLGDLCDYGDGVIARPVSPLSRMRALQQLFLSRARLTRVCADWLRDMHELRRLDLTYNQIESLSWSDLRVHRSVAPADVDLSGNPLARVLCSEQDYTRARTEAIPGQRAQLVSDARLACDCGAYWLARALNDSLVPVAFEPRCAAARSRVSGESIPEGLPLRLAARGALVCPVGAGGCAAGCACERDGAGGLRVACACERDGTGCADAAGSLPRALLALPVRELHAHGLGLRQLPDALPDQLQVLDLHDNGVARASAAAARALLAGGRRARLTRNPLRCACDNWPLLETLRARRTQVIEYENTTCSDGRPLEAAVRALQCSAGAGGRGWLAPALALLAAAALLAAVGAALVSRPETRLRLKALLHARGVRARWLRRRFEPADVDRPFDTYVVHAEEDARFAYETLAARLEPARRLCLADRDWPVGAWIPEMIDESVRRSRRTLCVLSPRSLSDKWVRASLRAAHAAELADGSPRVVLVLLGVTPAELRGDGELRAGLDAHPLARWGEPCFWEKLQYALPDPRPPPAPPAAA